MNYDVRPQHRAQVEQLSKELSGNTQRIVIRKKTVSNRFQYDVQTDTRERTVDLSEFDKPLYLDEVAQTLDVQGSTTCEAITDFTIPRGFLPQVLPGFKHITIAGAIAGIAIDANCYKYGFAHDGLLEADVLLTDGRVVMCTPDNEYADLFRGLPNSYGTLGFILRVKIKLHPVTPYVELTTTRYSNTESVLSAMERATHDSSLEYIENLTYSPRELYLTTGRHVEHAPKLLNIYGSTIFYKEISKPGTLYLTTKDYIFRYDPEWFWGLPQTPLLRLFRLFAPPSLRNSDVYKRQYAKRAAEAKKQGRSALPDDLEHLIQDWQVPWRHAKVLTDYALATVDIRDKPWLSTPIKTPAWASLYPMQKNELYLNLGCYTFAKKRPGKEPYFNTKDMDAFCFAHEGTKMLYSTTFMEKQAFESHFAGEMQRQLKEKYDSQKLLPTLFERAVMPS